jgi:hypothetical protein
LRLDQKAAANSFQPATHTANAVTRPQGFDAAAIILRVEFNAAVSLINLQP